MEAARRAISSPMLEETSIEGAKGVLLNVSGGRDLTRPEVAEACRIIQEAVDPGAGMSSRALSAADVSYGASVVTSNQAAPRARCGPSSTPTSSR
jgi:cell division GTPase FtsZ